MSALPYTDHHIEWEGIAVLVKWCPRYFGVKDIYQIAHLEIHAANKTPLPITETGYKSHFIDKETVEALGGPVAYARTWLDEAAASPEWKARAQASRQLSLF
tara:strand:+ start:1466 stop:1771 length:306 start_codon:yes stop_codon:yes gene_type:complete